MASDPSLIPPRPDTGAPSTIPVWPYATWRKAETVAVFFMPLGISIYATIFVRFFLTLRGDAVDIVGGVFQEAILVLGVVLWVRVARREPLHVLATPTRPAGDLLVGIGVGVGALFATGATEAIARAVAKGLLGHVPAPPAATDAVRGPWIAPGVILLVILAPLGEEVLFRGWLYQGLRQWLSPLKAAALSSAAFAWVHVYPINLPGVFVGGLLLASVYERRRSLLASMAAHATLNTIVVAVALVRR